VYDHAYVVADAHRYLTEDGRTEYTCKACGHEAFENSNINTCETGLVKGG
jgi:hypothetical protein